MSKNTVTLNIKTNGNLIQLLGDAYIQGVKNASQNLTIEQHSDAVLEIVKNNLSEIINVVQEQSDEGKDNDAAD